MLPGMARHALWVLMLAVACLAGGCGGPRQPAISRVDALHDVKPREFKVIKVWDEVRDNMDTGRDPHISHVIEVEVLSGPDQGRQLTLPYDEWNVGKAPPTEGERVVIAPADWVKRDPDSKGRPFGGW